MQDNNTLIEDNFHLFNQKDILNDELIKISNELSKIKTINFNLQQENNNIKYKNKELTKIIAKTNNKNTSNNENSDKENEKFYIDYHEVTNLSINKMIKILIYYGNKYNEIKDLQTHTLKQMINHIENEKMKREFNI